MAGPLGAGGVDEVYRAIDTNLKGQVAILVEGDDLSQRIARGAIPIDEALPIAKQIAEALEAAPRARDHSSRPEAREHQGARGPHQVSADRNAATPQASTFAPLRRTSRPISPARRGPGAGFHGRRHRAGDAAPITLTQHWNPETKK